MDYELAKELKDAGWKQNARKVSRGNPKPTYPTLSALIKACGDDFLHLRWNKHYRKWTARAYTDDLGGGETPEEAVARLWLKLKK